MNLRKLNKNVILSIMLFIIVLFSIIYLPSTLEDMKKGEPYTMSHVELIKKVELGITSNSVTYDFVAKKNGDRLRIVLHFNNFSFTTQKLKELYKDTNIAIYDKTSNKLMYSGIIGDNFLEDSLSRSGVMVFIPLLSSSRTIQKNHEYIIIIENLPLKNDLSPAYNSFILVVGQVKRSWL